MSPRARRHHRQVAPAHPVTRGESRNRLTAALVRTAGRLDTLLAVQRRLTGGLRRHAPRVHARLPAAPARAALGSLRGALLESGYRQFP